MMIHKVIGIIGLLVYAHASFAQGEQNVKVAMNNIKNDLAYIKVEVNDASKESAFEQAVEELMALVAEALNGKEDTVLPTREELLPHLQSLEMWRGDRIRLFVYAEWAKVLNRNEIEEHNENEEIWGIGDDEEIEDNGEVEEYEEVEDSEIKNDGSENQSLQNENVEDDSHSEDIEVVIIDSSEEGITVEEPGNPISMEKLAVVESLSLMETVWDVQDALRQFKASGQIKQYGSPRDVQNQLDDKFVVVFDQKKHTMKAILTPREEDGRRINLLNQQEESMEQYKGKGNKAIYFE